MDSNTPNDLSVLNRSRLPSALFFIISLLGAMYVIIYQTVFMMAQDVDHDSSKSESQDQFFVAEVNHPIESKQYPDPGLSLVPAAKVVAAKQLPSFSSGDFKFVDVSADRELISKSAKHLIPWNTKYSLKDFVIGYKLGEGTNAIVYEGTFKPTGRKVAIKVYRRTDEASLIQFEKDVLYMRRLEAAPFTCHILYWINMTLEEARKTLGTSRHRFLLVTDLANRGDMFDRIHKHLITDDLARKWMSQLVVAVQHMHAHGIIHRDLKLENVLLSGNDDILLCDFGYSKRFKTAHHKDSKILGTMGFIPSEIILGKHASYSSDIFALGMILYHFITADLQIASYVLDEAMESFENGEFGKLVKSLEEYEELPVRENAPVGALELFRGMVRTTNRLTLVQVMQSEYFEGVYWRSLGALEAPISI